MSTTYSQSLSIHVVFFNDTATTEIYTLSLHDALPILPVPDGNREHGGEHGSNHRDIIGRLREKGFELRQPFLGRDRKSNTSELQSRQYLVCRLLLEKKQNSSNANISYAIFCL